MINLAFCIGESPSRGFAKRYRLSPSLGNVVEIKISTIWESRLESDCDCDMWEDNCNCPKRVVETVESVVWDQDKNLINDYCSHDHEEILASMGYQLF